MISVHLGDTVRDAITNFEGKAVARYIFLNGCNRIHVQPTVNEDGTLPESKIFDEPNLTITTKEGPRGRILNPHLLNLGDQVKDSRTGFKGMAVSRYEYLQGCDRICVQPKAKRGSILPETRVFDEPDLIVTTSAPSKKTKPKKKMVRSRPGGPPLYEPGAMH